jgi:hypothetical protein
MAVHRRDIRLALLLRAPLEGYSHQEVSNFIAATYNSPLPARNFYLSRFVLGSLLSEELFPHCAQVLSDSSNAEVSRLVFSQGEYLRVLKTLLTRGQAARLLDLSVEELVEGGQLREIDSSLLLKVLLSQFSEGFVEIESPYGSTLGNSTIRTLLRAVCGRRKEMEGVKLGDFARLTLHFLRMSGVEDEEVVCFLLGELMRLGAAQHEEITRTLVKENQSLIALVEDEDLLQELEARLRQSELL